MEAAGTENWLGFESDDPDIQPGRALPYADGFMAVRTSNGVYLEGRLVKAIAYDRAGNSTESDEIRVYVRAKPQEPE